MSEPSLDLHLQQLAYIKAIEEHETLTAAAEALHVSQSALSQAVARVEQRLGVPLLEKAGRRRSFTAAGREVAAFASDVLLEARELRERLEALEAGRAGKLRLGMIDAVSLYLLPDVLRSFREAHPELEVEISVDRSGVLADRLGRHELDLAFLIGPLDEGFGGERIAIEALRAYGPPGMRLPRPDAEWFLYPRGSRTRRLIDAGLAREGIEPQVTLESSNPQVLRQLVALGLGWAVLPEAVAGTGDPPLPRSGVPRLAEREVLLAWRLSGPPRAAAAALYSFVAGPR